MKTIKQLIFILLPFIFVLITQNTNADNRWEIMPDGSIQWNINQNIPHNDHIEMSGEQLSVVFRYGVTSDGSFSLERSLVWPMLRTIPNNTHASLMQRFSVDIPSLLIVNGLTIQKQTVKSIRLDGKMTVTSECGIGYVNVGNARNRALQNTVEITSVLFPSTTLPALCEEYTVKNITDRDITVLVPDYKSVYSTPAERGVDGSYTMVSSIQNKGTYTIKPNETITFGVTFQAYKKGQEEHKINVSKELAKRIGYVNEVWNNLALQTPDPVINTEFNFAKIRASESIFKTKAGYMHAPGGESYYAAIWANDQAEYVNPFFPYLGYKTGNLSALNSFQHFARFMNPEYRSIPSSIIAEGDDIWHGVGDRGDGAMIAYGASRYALARGDKKEAEELWPLIEWCLEYCQRQINADGVVASNTDELEFRFPAGNANLTTSCLYYDALLSAAYLGKDLKKPASQLTQYKNQAQELRVNIEKFFGAKVEGFDTYRYYRENDILRSWICIPLTVGIYERAQGTIDALLSPRLWTKDGLLTQAGSDTFWDRSTLYALRGLFEAGARNKAEEYLNYYSAQRLLGNHVPYPIEAWPEGSQRHLSAESGLYCRIITEGLFGIRPTGLKSFSLTVQLPESWDQMFLRSIKAFDTSFDIEVIRAKDKVNVTVIKEGKRILRKTISNGKALQVSL